MTNIEKNLEGKNHISKKDKNSKLDMVNKNFYERIETILSY